MAGFKYIFKAVTLPDTKRLARAFGASLAHGDACWSYGKRFGLFGSLVRPVTVAMDGDHLVGKGTFARSSAVAMTQGVNYEYSTANAYFRDQNHIQKIWSNWTSDDLKRQVRIYDALLTGPKPHKPLTDHMPKVDPLPTRIYPGVDFIENPFAFRPKGPLIVVGLKKMAWARHENARIITIESYDKKPAIDHEAFAHEMRDLRVGEAAPSL